MEEEAFRLFDTDGDGKISINELGTVFRAIGQNPTEAEVEEIKKEAGGALVDFDRFKDLLKRHKKDSNLEKDVRDAWKVFDKDGKGIIDANELKNVLTTMGEKLKDEEVDAILQHVNKGGQVKVDDFVQTLSKPGTKK
eukprot:TRINITY_DN6114_c0_g1_i1.p1 TRINITY_DN6114_c0_g1~~TRINITY_DN6114_c0_g1_i1.p1  ORF type:complete len:155 (+),score=65.61 TRINITY_DN6114_c0_g1_i1:53-466(+)